MKNLHLLILGFLMTGCAVPTTGVVPARGDMYTVTRQGAGAWVTTDSLKTEAIREAESFCSGKGKKVDVLHAKDIQAGAFGRWPESEVLFKCN